MSLTGSYTGSSTSKWQKLFINFSHFKCDKNHFFGNFVHKTFAQFILYTFRCILICIDAFWSLRTKCTIFVRKIVNFSLFYWIKTISLSFLCIKQFHSAYCTHFNAFWWILTHSEHLEQDVENSFFCWKWPIFF